MFLSGMVGTAQGCSEKKYKVTTSGIWVGLTDSEFSPGAFVNFAVEGSSSVTVLSASGVTIPYRAGLISVYVPDDVERYYFVMPAEDVTIS